METVTQLELVTQHDERRETAPDRPSTAPTTSRLADFGDVLTIEEAAEVLRISRSSAYDLARRWRSDDPTGLPNIRLGRFLRVPRSALEEVLARPAQLYASLATAAERE